MSTATVALRARYVFPVDGPPIADGLVQIEGERIVAVGRDLPGPAPIDLGDVALLPGLVNVHAHLEFSDLAQPLGKAGMPFTDWIRTVLAYRGGHAGYASSRRLGQQESLRHGVTTVADIATLVPGEEPYEPPPDAVVFREVIAPRSERGPSALADCRAFLESDEPDTYLRGLSPHAPYTVHRDVLRDVIRCAAEFGAPVAFHLAESPDELELLRTGRGPLRKLLEERGVWDATAIALGSRPLEYLRDLAETPRALVIHGNYLDDEEQAFLAAHRERMALVYCPRTHAYFGHPPYPLAQMLSRGIQVAVGTDSRASNPDLSLLEELRFIARHHSGTSPADVLALGTIRGAEALGLAEEVGSLSPGKLANLAVVRLPGGETREPHELVFDSAEPVIGTYWRGQRAPASPFG